MNQEQLNNLIKLGEGFTTEFKRSGTRNIGRELCAFANATGGSVLIGVADNSEIIGVILFPHGVLFRNEEQAMREKLVAHDVVECVLGLGPNLFYNSPMEACVVICRMNKPKARKNKVLFINALSEVTRERAQSFLTDDHIQRIVKAYQDFRDKEGFAKVVRNEEIRGKESNLSIPLYVRVNNGNGGDSKASDQISLKQAISDWQESSRELRSSMDDLMEMLKAVDISQ